MLNLQEAAFIASQINQSKPDQGVLAIPYKEEDSCLIGTFLFEGKHYAIAYLEQHNPDNLLSKSEQIEVEKKDIMSNTFNKMSDYVKFKIEKYFGEKTPIYKTDDGRVFSQIDLKFEDPETIKLAQPLTNHKTGEVLQVEHFFKTDKAIQFILDVYMDKKEREEFLVKVEEETPNIEKIVLTSLPTKENPVVLDLVGIDDISFSKTFETVEQAINVLNQITEHGHDIVLKEMYSSY